jgi:peptidoglycan/xylan/chitin deacetylase (PgdA/CDA1 family)
VHNIFLTFDDGPDPVHTAAVLDELARRNLKAVFFVQSVREIPQNT